MDYIQIKKQINTILKQAHDNSKLNYCLCCKKECSGFCNSHTLPRFVLKNIDENGLVLSSNNYFKMPMLETEKGLKKSGTFKRICNECDKKLFKNYEDESLLQIPPRKRIMTQIDLKNSLRMYDKRLNEIALYDILLAMNPDEYMLRIFLEKQKVNRLDLDEIINETTRDLNILTKESSSNFNLIFWKKLEYVCPIAFQGHIALLGDLEGNIINNIYNNNKNYVIENLNICIFPLKKSTIVMVFINKDNKKYKLFINQFKKLKIEEQLNLISYIVFNYNEEFFLSKKANDDIINNEKLDCIVQNTTDFDAFDENMADDVKKNKFFELKEYKKFPNILAKEYSLEVVE